MAQELGIKPVLLSGHLHALWHNVLEQQEDGDLAEWPDSLIAQMAMYEGDASEFVSLLRKHKWLDGNLVHDWMEYAGKFLWSRYHTHKPKKLKAIHRLHRYNLSIDQVYSKDIKGKPSRGLGLVRLGRVRLGKEKSEKNNYSEAFENWWSLYPRQSEKKKAFAAYKASLTGDRRSSPATTNELDTAADNYTKSVKGIEECYIKLPATFLGLNEPWRDFLKKPKELRSKVLKSKSQELEEKTQQALNRELPQ